LGEGVIARSGGRGGRGQINAGRNLPTLEGRADERRKIYLKKEAGTWVVGRLKSEKGKDDLELGLGRTGR